MKNYKDLLTVFQKPIGQNVDNNPDDIKNLKEKLKHFGHYKNDETSGYIDKELDESIHAYQSKRGLKHDGIVKPGGETEATLFGDVFKLDDEPLSKTATLPAIIHHAPKIYQTGKRGFDAWKEWQKISPSERQDEIDDIEKERQRCSEVQDICIDNCEIETLPTNQPSDQGMKFHQCYGRCMRENNCKY